MPGSTPGHRRHHGAFGAALIARERYHMASEPETSMLSLEKIIGLKYSTSMTRCKGCNNTVC